MSNSTAQCGWQTVHTHEQFARSWASSRQKTNLDLEYFLFVKSVQLHWYTLSLRNVVDFLRWIDLWQTLERNENINLCCTSYCDRAAPESNDKLDKFFTQEKTLIIHVYILEKFKKIIFFCFDTYFSVSKELKLHPYRTAIIYGGIYFRTLYTQQSFLW